jgi:hypothetical protein
MAPPPRYRPLGVTILAVLEIIVGVFMIVAALGVLVLAGYLSTVSIPSEIQQNIPQWFIDIAPTALAIGGIALLIVGVISFLIAWGFLKGRNWARIVAIVLLFISVLTSIFNAIVAAVFTTGALFSLIVAIIIPVLLIWYLYTPKVKMWFRA